MNDEEHIRQLADADRRGFNPAAWLAQQSTRSLMLLRKSLYGCGQGYCISGDNGVGPEVSMDEVKAELAKRPHVPNKLEAEELRRRRAKARHGRGKEKSR